MSLLLILSAAVNGIQARGECGADDSAAVCLEAGLQREYEAQESGLESLERACGMGSTQACFHHALGRRARGDTSAALTLDEAGFSALQQRCSIGQTVACHHLALVHLDGPVDYRDSSQGMMLLSQACDQGAWDACIRQSKPLRESADPQVRAKGLESLKAGCEAQHARSCLLLGQSMDPGPAREDTLKKACAAGAQEACP